MTNEKETKKGTEKKEEGKEWEPDDSQVTAIEDSISRTKEKKEKEQGESKEG